MSIYRGAGGSGDATNDATVSQVQTLASQAATSATNAASSATAAAGSASTAATQASLATSAKNDSQANATTVAGYVASALASQTAASGSATAAAASATAAALSAGDASGSASDALDSANTATTQATAASTSATNSANSAASALAIYGNTTAMNTAVTNASNSATSAATSATNAATSASNASSSASAASSSASAASISASAAAMSAGNANTSASNAAASESSTLSIYGSTSAVNDAVNNSLANRNAAAASATAASTSASASATSATSSATSASAAATSAAAASAVALGNEPVRHSVRPSLLLDFANTKQLDPRITFTRASTATFYDGKTTAKAEENLMLYSQSIGGTIWSTISSSVTLNNAISPDNTTTATLLLASTGTAIRPTVAQTIQAIAGTISVYAKTGTAQFFQIAAGNSAYYANFDLVNGTVGNSAGGTASIQSVGNGWYRCILVNSATASTLILGIVNASTAPAQQAWNPVGTESVYLWGAQLEQRSSVTAYTPTTTAAITNYIPALQTAASGVARFDHNPTTGESLGLLIEEQRTNLLTYSEQFDNAAWNKTNASVISNTIFAPDGTLSGDLFVPLAVSGNPNLKQTILTVSTAYTSSVYAKAAGLRYFVISNAGATPQSAIFDLQSGVVSFTGASATASITSIGNGWYRCTCSFTAAYTALNYYATNSATSIATFTNDGWSGYYIWGAQLEAGAFATSYIPTVASQVTRPADAASLTGTNFSSWYNAAEGSYFINYRNNDLTSPPPVTRFVLSMDGSANKRVIYQGAGSNVPASYDGTTSLFTANNLNINTSNLIVSSYTSNSKSLVLNAGTVVTGVANATYSQATSLYIGSVSVSPTISIKKLSYYPKQLTSAEIQGLTTV